MGTEMWIALALVAFIIFVLIAGKNRALAASRIYQQYGSIIRRASIAYSVPAELIVAVIQRESNGDPDAVGSAGEKGLMQLKDIAVRDANEFGLTPRRVASFRPEENIMDGAAFLSLQKRRAGTWFDALRAYNKGYASSLEFQENGAGYARNVIQKAKELGYA